jgi:hypothetical protein
MNAALCDRLKFFRQNVEEAKRLNVDKADTYETLLARAELGHFKTLNQLNQAFKEANKNEVKTK